MIYQITIRGRENRFVVYSFEDGYRIDYNQETGKHEVTGPDLPVTTEFDHSEIVSVVARAVPTLRGRGNNNVTIQNLRAASPSM